ncbi:MAG: DUF4230 domain-containing protein [Fibrobacter sp.]|nr:DUF4230 domain-containing protein [Fibrobacter sp.]
MKIIAKALSVCIVFCAIIVLIMAGISHLSNKENTAIEKKPKITSEFVGNRIQEISELATLAHHYRKNANYEDAKKLLKYLPDWRINKSIKNFSLIYEGEVKMGYDLKDIKVGIDTTAMTIEITLPEPKILSHSIDFESIDIICENKGWFNEIKLEDFKKFFVEEQKAYEATNRDLLNKRAREQAERIITLYLESVINIVNPNLQADSVADSTSQTGKPAVEDIKKWLPIEDGYKLNIK